MKTYAQENQLKNTFSLSDRLKSFTHAFRGIRLLFLREANAKIQLIAGILVIALAIILQIKSNEWMILIACIGWVLFAEAINTVIENIADFIHPEYHSKINALKNENSIQINQ